MREKNPRSRSRPSVFNFILLKENFISAPMHPFRKKKVSAQ